MERCPTCQSSAPHLHPSVQFEGEVQVCKDLYHLTPTNQNNIEYKCAACSRHDAWLREEAEKLQKEAPLFNASVKDALENQVGVFGGDWMDLLIPHIIYLEKVIQLIHTKIVDKVHTDYTGFWCTWRKGEQAKTCTVDNCLWTAARSMKFAEYVSANDAVSKVLRIRTLLQSHHVSGDTLRDIQAVIGDM